jgi:DNA polymerase I-like protein with 3'-5' exonuclease and polymerase domains
MGMGKIVSKDWEQTASGLLIPAPPKFFQRNQLVAWRKYFSDRAELYEWAKQKSWRPSDDKLYIAMDIETDDPHINDFGPGALRGLGEILGVGVYSPQLHLHDYLNPFDKRIREWFSRDDVVLIFHNAVYDLDWLYNWEKSPSHKILKCRIEDTMTRQSLIDTYSPSFGLDYCCSVFGLEGKNKEDTIESWWEAHTGKAGKLAIKNLKSIPRDIVGKYCKQDAKATFDLFCAQQPCLEREELVHANDIECRLYPWLLATRANGIRIDNIAREKLSEDVTAEAEQYEQAFRQHYGDYNINSNKQLQELWKQLGLPYEYSKTGSISFGYDQMLEFKNGGSQLHMTDEQLKIAHDVATDILQIREYRKLLDTFVDGQFVDMQYNGRIYTCLYPSKRDGSGGTVTGRFSSANPNLQQVPAHSEWGKQTRSIFIPEADCLLGAFDYKQIEYRLFTHFAQGEEGKAAQKLYHENPALDYHEMGQKMMGWWYPDDEWANKEARHMMKRLSFGNLYGLKAKTFSEHFKWDLLKSHPNCKQEDLYYLAQSLQSEYQEKVPFIKVTNEAIMKVGQRRGYVKTLSGKRQRMPPNPSKGGDDAYKLINYLVQGSAGDVFKKGVCVDAWNAGVFDVLIPHLMVHDEMVFSIPQTKQGYEACVALKECMANAYPLKVPLGVDTEIGKDWGHCNGDTWEEFKAKWQ